MTNAVPAFELRAITKRFPGVVANDRVSFSAQTGEIHALLGENGAGKSTLMNVLSGLYAPDEGEILVHGRPVRFHSPRDAIRAGIGMVHQHFMLVPSQTVAENLILGLPGNFILHPAQIEAEVRRLSTQYGLPLDPQAKIWQLSVGEQQRVEILKMLYRGADILILDEPTAVLTPQESELFFQTLRSMREQGKTIIFISHKLEEVLAIADRVTVLRAGKVVATTATAGMSRRELASLMVGREVLFQVEKEPGQPGEPRLILHEVEALDEKALPALRKLSLRVHRGEIVGVAGVAGNGQRELAEVIAGLRPLMAGSITVDGHPIATPTPAQMIAAGVAYVPEDRRTTGSAPNLSITENVALKAYRSPTLTSGPLVRWRRLAERALALVRQYSIATPTMATPVRKLSGGNLQKVILAREIASQPGVLVTAYPTRGLDIGATEQVRTLLLEERSRGVAILLISEDLEELLLLADRIVVLYEGQIIGDLAAAEADLPTLGLLMAGGVGEGDSHLLQGQWQT
jgi:general nucleoside transport system ATP-binding protein